MEHNAVALAQRISHERLRRGWSRSDLARKAGIDPSYVTRVEQAKFVAPSVEKIRAISAAFGLPVDALTDPPDPSTPGEDVLLRKLLERKMKNKPNAEMIQELIDQAAGKAPVDPETRATIVDVFGTLTRTLPKHHG
jgi:transcriptional regulator with XRE-family HTH domain